MTSMAHAPDGLAAEADLGRRTPLPDTSIRSTLARARTGLYLGAAAAVPLALMPLLFKLSTGTFHHTADYFYTATGIPVMLAPLIFLPALHTLHRGQDGRLGRAGLLISRIGLLVYIPLFCYGVAAGSGTSIGPTYVLAALATFIGLGLFATGTYRARMLPRWIAPLWFIAWIVGGPFAINGVSLLLAVVYLTIANHLSKAR